MISTRIPDPSSDRILTLAPTIKPRSNIPARPNRFCPTETYLVYTRANQDNTLGVQVE